MSAVTVVTMMMIEEEERLLHLPWHLPGEHATTEAEMVGACLSLSDLLRGKRQSARRARMGGTGFDRHTLCACSAPHDRLLPKSLTVG